MFENRDLRHDIFALALLALVVFLAVSLATYDPADPVARVAAELGGWYQADILVQPQNEQIQNACGRWGALAAEMMFQALGLGAWFAVLSLAVLDGRLLLRREVNSPIVRTIGWMATLVGLTTLLATFAPHLSPGPVIGSGGYLGALGCGLARMHFATAGCLILSVSFVVGGLLLSTDYALLQIGSRLASSMSGFLGGGLRTPRKRPKRKVRKQPRKSTASAEEEEMSVRISGRRLEATDVEDVSIGDPDEATEDAAADADDAEIQTDDWDATDETGEAELTDDATATDEEPAEEEEEELSVTTPADRNAKRKNSSKQKSAKSKEREEVIQSLEAAALPDESEPYELPDIDLLIDGDDVSYDEQAKEVRRKAKILEKTFADFGFKVKVVEIETGPVIAQYEVQLEAGLRLSKITDLADDLAIALRVPSVRIVAPIPGKNTVGIEVPNDTRQIVRLREVIEESNGKLKKMRIPLFLGKDVSGNALTVDLSTLPHLLIAGRTGTGKSVCLNAIINSILMTRRPDEVRMLMIDPKMVELSGYGRLPHLMHPVVTDMKKAEAILAWAVDKMEERYSLLAKAGVRHISSYNQLSEEELVDRLEPEDDEQREAIPLHLPFIVIVADEMADLMMTAGKEVEQHIIRLAQKSRAVGIHLILATQKPTVDVITGLIKSNLPARISFQVASRTDSRVVLDEMGADKLLGNGDMLFLWPGTSSLLRGQGTYVSDDEIDSVVDSVSTHEQDFVNELVNMKVEDGDDSPPGELRKRDELYDSAINVVVQEGRGSVSLLQRTLGIGYGRAARLIDYMAEDKIVGEYNGSQAREVLLSPADWERMQGHEPEEEVAAEPPTKRRRSNKVQPDPDDDATDSTTDDASDESADEYEDVEYEDVEDDVEDSTADDDDADEEYDEDNAAAENSEEGEWEEDGDEEAEEWEYEEEDEDDGESGHGEASDEEEEYETTR